MFTEHELRLLRLGELTATAGLARRRAFALQLLCYAVMATAECAMMCTCTCHLRGAATFGNERDTLCYQELPLLQVAASMHWTGFSQEGLAGFPLPAEAWLDELLASIFRMLVNLESTDAKGKDHITFLMNDSSLYR